MSSTDFSVNSQMDNFCRYQCIASLVWGSRVGAYVYLAAVEAGSCAVRVIPLVTVTLLYCRRACQHVDTGGLGWRRSAVCEDRGIRDDPAYVSNSELVFRRLERYAWRRNCAPAQDRLGLQWCDGSEGLRPAGDRRRSL
jgi:hypothetical protein